MVPKTCWAKSFEGSAPEGASTTRYMSGGIVLVLALVLGLRRKLS
jgi:hypothetical protein